MKNLYFIKQIQCKECDVWCDLRQQQIQIQGKKVEAQQEYSEAKRLGLNQNFMDFMGGM